MEGEGKGKKSLGQSLKMRNEGDNVELIECYFQWIRNDDSIDYILYFILQPIPLQNIAHKNHTISLQSYTPFQFHHKLYKYVLFFLFYHNNPMEKHTWRKVISLSSTTLPSPRWGHASCLADGQLLIFGGYADSQYKNDLWAYDTSNMTWQQCITSGLVPSPRSNCTLHYDAPMNRLVLFGGGGPNKLRYNDVSVLDWESKEWTRLEPPLGEQAPWERTYHSSELLYPYLLIFGGEGLADLGDLWAFHLQTHRWSEIKTDRTKEGPCPRRFHSSATIGSTLLIIAGCHDKYRCLSDVYSLDLQPFISNSPGYTLEWKEIKLKGASFLTRWGHSCSVYGGRVYIFGGRFSSDLQDILVLDPIKQTLKTMKVQGETPKPRRRHSGNFVGSNLIVFGGFNGQYFNDLNYINLFQLPPKRSSLREDFNDAAMEWVNRSLLSNFQLRTKDDGIFYGHKGLIIDKLADKGQWQQFIDEIEGKYTSQQLEELFSILYCGVGRIPAHFDLAHIPFTLFDSCHEKQACFMHFLKGQPLEPTLLLPKGKKSQVMSLSTPSYSDFLQSRATLHTDFFIILGEYCLPANRMLLAASSKFFLYLLGHHQQLNQLHLDLPQQLGDVRVLQVLLNFLERGHLVVPEGLDVDCWKSLMRLGEYFCIPIRHFCEEQLINRITHQNCQELLEYGLKESLQDLQGHCLQFTFRSLLQSGEEILKTISHKKHKTGMETALSNLYRLWEFDLDQTDLTRKEKQVILKPQTPAQHAKENHHTVLP